MFKQGLKAMGVLGVIVYILYSSFLFADGPDTLWTKTYGGIMVDVLCFSRNETRC